MYAAVHAAGGMRRGEERGMRRGVSEAPTDAPRTAAVVGCSGRLAHRPRTSYGPINRIRPMDSTRSSRYEPGC